MIWNHTGLSIFLESIYDEKSLKNFAESEGLKLRTEVQERLVLIQTGKVSSLFYYILFFFFFSFSLLPDL